MSNEFLDNSVIEVTNSNQNNNERNNSTSVGDVIFECNICLEQVSEPVVTLCGHLYCWKCLYRWLNNNNICPVCKAGVTKDNVVPIYSRGAGDIDPRNRPIDNGIPNRPVGQRPIPEIRNPNTRFGMSQQDVTFSPAFGFFPSLFGLQFQITSNNVSPGAATIEETQQTYLSRMLLMLGSFVILCLLLF